MASWSASCRNEFDSTCWPRDSIDDVGARPAHIENGVSGKAVDDMRCGGLEAGSEGGWWEGAR
jgi:hypothetical protein